MMIRHMKQRILAAATMIALASCGGSSSGTQDVTVTELPHSDQSALSGDWPLDETTAAFLITNDDQWQAAWSNRKSTLECGADKPYNEAACAADLPPVVDFSTYSLVGLLLDPISYFVEPAPMRVFIDEKSRLLVVEYQYHTPFKVPFYYVTGTRFFLVPKTDAQLSATATQV